MIPNISGEEASNANSLLPGLGHFKIAFHRLHICRLNNQTIVLALAISNTFNPYHHSSFTPTKTWFNPHSPNHDLQSRLSHTSPSSTLGILPTTRPLSIHFPHINSHKVTRQVYNLDFLSISIRWVSHQYHLSIMQVCVLRISWKKDVNKLFLYPLYLHRMVCTVYQRDLSASNFLYRMWIFCTEIFVINVQTN